MANTSGDNFWIGFEKRADTLRALGSELSAGARGFFGKTTRAARGAGEEARTLNYNVFNRPTQMEKNPDTLKYIKGVPHRISGTPT